jgi:hypothetical protein
VAVVIVISFGSRSLVRTSTLSGLTVATPDAGTAAAARGKPLRVSPYGLNPPRLAARLWTYTTPRDINAAFSFNK